MKGSGLMLFGPSKLLPSNMKVCPESCPKKNSDRIGPNAQESAGTLNGETVAIRKAGIGATLSLKSKDPDSEGDSQMLSLPKENSTPRNVSPTDPLIN